MADGALMLELTVLHPPVNGHLLHVGPRRGRRPARDRHKEAVWFELGHRMLPIVLQAHRVIDDLHAGQRAPILQSKIA